MTRTPKTDTSPAIAARQIEVYRSMPEVERLRLALEMSAHARSLTRARLREEHPGWTDRQLNLEMARQAMVAELPGRPRGR